MKRSNNEYEIQYTGLKPGVHEFDFTADREFFDLFEREDVLDADLGIHLKLDCGRVLMTAKLSIKGTVQMSCDVCNTPVSLPVELEDRIVYRFGDEHVEDGELVVLGPEDFTIDLTHPIYELVMLNLPLRKVHPEGECDPEVMEHLERYLTDEPGQEDDDEAEPDHRWDELKKLKQEKKEDQNGTS